MATRAAKVARDADIQKRLDAAITALSERIGIDIPPAFPYVRDPEFRAIDERDRMATILERVLEAGIMADNFRVVNDQTGDSKDCTLEQFQQLQAQGYRIENVNSYQAAMQRQLEQRQQENPRVVAAPSASDAQSKADADLTARQTFPEADAGEEDMSADAPVHEQNLRPSSGDGEASVYDDMTMAEIREDLEAEGINPPKNARKADLVALAEQHLG